ncbi:hypothetical protein [Leptospira jelokensis]|uniref:hypothetical protein n=1 Tax=Leptospira jelokensis TaxID=2484931 RepID=UPI00109156FA|nr:hypothetical protein [Leptospira jelokensis]
MVFDSPGGLDDIRAAYVSNLPEYQILSLDGEVIKSLERYVYGQNFGDYEFYLKTKDDQKKNSIYKAYLTNVIKFLVKRINLKVIINFNFVYEAQRPLMEVCKKLNLKFLTVMKECLRTPGYIDGTVKVYKDKIVNVNPDLILVHNDQTKDLLIRSEIYESNQIKVIGQPRSDVLIQFAEKKITVKNDKEKKQVLFFAISETAGLPYFGDITGFDDEAIRNLGPNFRWFSLIEKTYRVLCDHCVESNSYRLIIKGKPTGVYGFKKISHPSIQYFHGNPDINLITKSDLVIGFNTTGLFEAIAAGIPTISSEIGVDEILGASRFLYDFQGTARIARTMEGLRSLVEEGLSQGFSVDPKNRKQVLDRYLGNSDGKAGVRLRAEIDKALHSS